MRDRKAWIQILGEQYFSSGTYRDEPILRTANTMRNFLPERCREMRRLSLQNGARSRTPEEIFYRQAKYMADYEDEYDYDGEFFRYFPTYQSMSDPQLRGYFTWRTHVRRGEIRRTSLSFVFIYLYELINLIGCDGAEDGFQKLRSFCEAYIQIDRNVERYAKLWLRDFIIYYGLDMSMLAAYMPLEIEKSYATLLEYETASDEALFDALCECSSYNLRNSRFYREQPRAVCAVTCTAYREWAAYYARNRKFTLFDAVVGRPYSTTFIPFASAVFYAPKPHPDVTLDAGVFSSFTCKDGRWSYTRLWSSTNSARQLGVLLKAVDAVMRSAWNYPHPLKSANEPKYLLKIVEDAIAAFREAETQRARREVKIDFGKLRAIREAADVTRDKLIVEEADLPESPDAALPEPEPEPASEMPAALSAVAASPPFALNESELAVLTSLLSGRDAEAAARSADLPLSVLADSINEKCFDHFADTVLVYEGDSLTVVEDYEQELKGILS